ncbi:hypothetical protein ACUNWD_11440 [Sunxiuqinia sp. A32]|uniref:hypothetical protein n=1 Tax=Sunxiuqinia sp. A32 TaxID=3461496 RepID=UPI0040467B16
MKLFAFIFLLSCCATLFQAEQQIISKVQTCENEDQNSFEVDVDNYIFASEISDLEIEEDDQDLHTSIVFATKSFNRFQTEAKNPPSIIINIDLVLSHHIWLRKKSVLPPPSFK